MYQMVVQVIRTVSRCLPLRRSVPGRLERTESSKRMHRVSELGTGARRVSLSRVTGSRLVPEFDWNVDVRPAAATPRPCITSLKPIRDVPRRKPAHTPEAP